MMNTPVDRSTDVVAVVAIASPWWLEPLQSGSEFAGLTLPILGCIWLVVQIIGYMRSRKK